MARDAHYYNQYESRQIMHNDDYYYRALIYDYRALIEAVRQRQYKDIPFKLRGLGLNPESFTPSYGIDLLNKNKIGCMRGILYIYKNQDDYGFDNDDFQNVLKGARKIGLAWPELDVLENSTGTVNEAAKQVAGDDIAKEIEDIFDDNNSSFYSPKRMILQRLILSYSALLDAVNIKDISGITAALNQLKHRIISDMLSNMRHGDTKVDMHMYIKTLQQFGIDWPELSIIEKSAVKKVNEVMRVDLKDPRERMLAKIENSFNDPNTDVFDRITELEIASSILNRISQADVDAILAKYRSSIIRDTLHYLRHGVVHIDFPVFVRLLQDLGADWPELKLLAKSVNPTKPQLDEAPRTPDEIIRDGFDYNIFSGIAALRIYYRQLAEFPEYEQLVNTHKAKLIRTLLELCKDKEFGVAKFRAEDLQTAGVDWPELDIILDSATHELNKFFGIDSADQLAEGISHAARYNMGGMLSSIEEDDPREMVLFLTNLAHSDSLPNLAKKLAPHKQFIVKALLDFLRYEEETAEPVDTVKDCLTALNNMGIYWPELTILRDSLNVPSKGDQNGQ